MRVTGEGKFFKIAEGDVHLCIHSGDSNGREAKMAYKFDASHYNEVVMSQLFIRAIDLLDEKQTDRLRHRCLGIKVNSKK